jgi:hypothetical protein
MSNIKPIQINPELFKISNHTVKNKTLKKNSKIKSNVLKKDLLARIKSHRANKNNNLEIDNTNTPTDNNINETNNTIVEKNEIKKQDLDIPITLENTNSSLSKKSVINNDDDFLQSIDFLKSLSKQKQNKLNKTSINYPLEKQSSTPSYGCLKNGTLPTFRNLHNNTLKKNNSNDLTDSDTINKPQSLNKRAVTFKYNLGKKHKVVSVLIKNVSTRKKISSEHTRLKESKINDMKNYLKRHNLLKSGSKCPPDVIKKMYEQALLSGDIRNVNKNSIVHNYLAE